MNRRSFLQLAIAAVAAEAIPFNRVWSFPSKIVVAKLETPFSNCGLPITAEMVRVAQKQIMERLDGIPVEIPAVRLHPLQLQAYKEYFGLS